jgi:hypothetical protein
MKGSYVSHKGKVWQKAGLYRVKKESSKTVRWEIPVADMLQSPKESDFKLGCQRAFKEERERNHIVS